MPLGRTITQKMWDYMEAVLNESIPLTREWKRLVAEVNALEADESADPGDVMDAHLKAARAEVAKTLAGAKGRGMSEALLLVLSPHFDSAEAVRSHAVARHKALAAGTPISTPGYDDPEPEAPAPATSATEAPKKRGPGRPRKDAAATKAPTPEEVIAAQRAETSDDPLRVRSLKIPEGTVSERPKSQYPNDENHDPNTKFKPKMSVTEALQRAAARQKAEQHPPQKPSQPSNTNVEQTPDDIAAQLEALEQE